MADYYKNNATDIIFISLDEGETLINPAGKKIPLNDKLFTELEDEAPITLIQEKAIELKEAFDEKREEADEEYYEKTTKVTYKGCKISLKDKKEIEAGKKAIVLLPRNRFEFRNTEGMSDEGKAQLERGFKARRAEQSRREDEAFDRSIKAIEKLARSLGYYK